MSVPAGVVLAPITVVTPNGVSRYVGTGNGLFATLPCTASAQLTPAGPLALPAGGSATLTATAFVPGFNVGRDGFGGSVLAVVVQPDGKVLVGGSFGSYNGNTAAPDYVLRLNADGSLDTSFNNGGTGADAAVSALALQADGQVLVGGNFTTYNGNAAAPYRVLRLNANGSLDTSFNPGGTGTNGTVLTLAVQPEGQVVIAGSLLQYNGQATVRLTRLNSDGSLDTSFNPGGAGFNNTVRSVALQPDGKVVVGGDFATYNGQAVGHATRLNTDGTPDAGFAQAAASSLPTAYKVSVQPDGKLVVGSGGLGTSQGQVLRLNPDGTTDASFLNPPADSYVRTLAVQPDGKLLVGGDFRNFNGQPRGALVRLNADGTSNDAPTPVPGATFVFSPGGGGNTLTVSAAGSYSATATDLATGCTYASNTVMVTFDAPLPVTLTSFTAVAQPQGVRLSWNTASEQHSAYFAVERSADGQLFAEIGRVAAAGTSGQPHHYELLDTQPLSGVAYYRLRQVDLDGSAHYSVVRVVAGPGVAGGMHVFPVPARTTATLLGAAPGALVQVFDTRGRLVATVTADAAGTAVLVLPTGLASGLYVVRAGEQATRLLVE